MFFDDFELTARKRAQLRVPPAVPETGWRTPSTFPNLHGNVQALAFDVETKETDFDHGPGWARGRGHIVGLSIAALGRGGERGKWYFPVRHEVEPEYNLEPRAVFGWAKELLETPNVPKIGANLLYDIGWGTSEDIYTEGELHDVQFAEALIDEQGETALDYLAGKYLKRAKTADQLYEWCARAYGGAVSDRQRSNIYRAPPRLVGPYAEDDADLCFDVLDKQWAILKAENTLDLYRLECDSIPLLIRMRLRGVRIDLPYAERLYVELGHDIKAKYEALHKSFGVHVGSVNSPADLKKLFDSVGVSYPRTAPSARAPEGNPSFVKEWLKELEHPAGQAVNEIREYEKVRGTFIKSYLLESNVRGRIHCQFHPLRSDDGGAKTGRYASSDPNLQNIPIRTEVGKRVRKAFVPDDGHIAWEKNDHSQIEYRMLANFASGPGSEELRETYNRDPKTDYHDNTFKLVAPFMGWNLDTMPASEKKERRRPLKNINFGLIYGQGEPSLAFKAGMDKAAAKEFFSAYHTAAPYVKPTMAAIAQEAQTYGYVQTVLGRRTRFDLWEPIEFNFSEGRPTPLPYGAALRRFGPNIKRAFEYRAVNYKLQGSAADALKHGMNANFKSGVYDFIGCPLLQVHDELDHSVIDDSPAQVEAYRFMRHTLETSIAPLLRIPLRVDFARAANWGSLD